MRSPRRKSDSDPFDFAIVGGTPLALLLAGFLAFRHQKHVCIVAPPASPYRLPRGFDLSIAPLTRPGRWADLTVSMPETVRLLVRMGRRAAVSRLDPLVIAGGAAGADALSHMQQVAAGFGYVTEHCAPRGMAAGSRCLKVHDAVAIQRAVIETSAPRWLQRTGVTALAEVDYSIAPNGEFAAEQQGRSIAATQTILADDAAVAGHCVPEEIGANFVTEPGLTVVTHKLPRLAAPLQLFSDRRVALWQDRDGTVVAHATGSGAADQVSAALGRSARISAQSRFTILASRDGAPVVGTLSGALVVAAFGSSGAFHAASLARHIAGVATSDETGFYRLHAPNRPSPSPVAEYAPRAAA